MNSPRSATVAGHPAAALSVPVGPAGGEVPADSTSAVSWGAILAGAAGAAALSLILLILGTGLGLSSVSPWVNEGASATAFGVSTIAWLTLTQIAASGMGGYLAGRLRTRWATLRGDEVYFRDTAHGFLAWAVATLVTAAVLTSAIGAIVGTGAQAGATMAGGAVAAGAAGAVATSSSPADDAPGSGVAMGYHVDALFRKNGAVPTASNAAPAAGSAMPGATSDTPAVPTAVASTPPVPTAEVARIFAHDLRAGSLPPDDARHLGQLIAQHTGLAQADAEKRVTDTFTRVQAQAREAETAAGEAADQARKASVGAALWLFLSLLIGAFVASLAATFGGRQRDL